MPSRSTAATTFSVLARRLEAACVHPDHAQAGRGVALVPGRQVGHRPQRVDAAEVPELDQHRPPALLVHPQRRDADPGQIARERRGGDRVLGSAHRAKLAGGWRALAAAITMAAARDWTKFIYPCRETSGSRGVSSRRHGRHPPSPGLSQRRINLRKLLMGAIVASATLAVAAGAVAQTPESTFNATVSPKDAGTKTEAQEHDAQLQRRRSTSRARPSSSSTSACRRA